MERMGLVKASWVRKDGKNVKLYELRTDSIQVQLTPEGYEAKFSSSSRPITVPIFKEVGIPSCPNFVGREKELVSLKPAGNFIVVEGIAGIGKTWLVARLVRQLAFKEVFWHAIKGFDTFDSVIRRLAIFLRAQGKTELYDYVKSNGPDKSVKLELLTKEVDNQRNVLVFDDYHACADKSIEDLIPHLKNNLRRTLVVLVSRTRPRFASEGGVTEHLLSGFTFEETAAFLSSRGLESSRALVNLVQEKLHGHPLSLQFLSEASRETEVESALESVKESKLLNYLWTQVYENLSVPERAVLGVMSVFRTPPSIDALRFVCGPKVAFSVYELERKHLATEVGQRYSLHDLVNEMAYRLVDSPEEAHKKIADYYLKEASLASRVEAVYHLLEAKEYEKAAKIVQEHYNVGDPILTSEYAVPYMELLRALPIEFVNKEHQPYVLLVIGRTERDFVDLRKAAETLSRALEIAEQQADTALSAKIEIALGRAYYDMGLMHKAENYLLEAADYFKNLKDQLWLAQAYIFLCELYRRRGLMDKALAYAHHFFQTAKRVPDQNPYFFRGVGGAHAYLGSLHGIMGKFAKARRHLRDALKIFQQHNEQLLIPMAQLFLISIYEEEGNFKHALALCEKNVGLCKSGFLRDYLVATKVMQARLLLKSRKEMYAEKELKEAVTIARALKGVDTGVEKVFVLGDIEMTLGMFHSRAKRWTEAVKHYRRALHILRQDVYGLGKVYQEFATMWLEKGDHERFKSNAEEAIRLLRRVGAEHRVRQLEKLLSTVQVRSAMTAPTLAPMQL